MTVYIWAARDPSLNFEPPLGSNRTIVVYVKEERPVGSFVFQPVVRDVDDASAVFRYQLNCTDNQYLAIDNNTGTTRRDLNYFYPHDAMLVPSVL